MKNICVITGASSGIGLQFFKSLSKKPYSYDEIWLIARRKERLEELKKDSNIPVKILVMDLSFKSSYEVYKKELEKEKPNIKLLVNNSGFGKFESTVNIGLEENLNMIEVNCQATVAMVLISIPYMSNGGDIINLSSVSAFQPAPYINTYAASKAFILNFSRAINKELSPQGIHVLAVCPFWTKTEFFDRAVIDKQHPIIKKYAVWYNTKPVVKRALKDIENKNKDVSSYGLINKLQGTLGRYLPFPISMAFWYKQQKFNKNV